MRWIDIAPVMEPDPGALIALARRAMERQPDSMTLRAALARGLYQDRRLAEALPLFEEVRRHDPAGFADWHQLTRCYAKLGHAADALRTSELGMAQAGETALLRLRQGEALIALGRHDEARAALERSVALGDNKFRALTLLLQPLVRREDATALLDYCDTLAPAQSDNALVPASRAIGLSRMRRAEEARALVDLDRDIAQLMIPVPDGYPNLAEFNAALARESIERRASAGARTLDIAYCPRLDGRPALAALLPIIRGAIDDYVRGRAARGLDAGLQPPPAAGQLFYGVTILRKDGANGEHIHEHGRVSIVYHVQVPDGITEAADDRGALSIGDCSEFSGGHAACWGRRRLKPRPGMLTLFPAHFFHDVVPSLVAEPRISIVADLIPVAR